MLVVSRKENQRIVFPRLGIIVEILRISGNAVRVGVEAPPQVRVLRSEVLDVAEPASSLPECRSSAHELRNRLNATTLALHLMQKQFDVGLVSEAEETLQRVLRDLVDLDQIATAMLLPQPSAECPTCRGRALLVEDDANERELLAGLLRLSGYEVDAVEDGLAALDYLAEHSLPDCVLLDMQMPRMDGPTTVAVIRENPHLRGIKVFAITGCDRELSDVPVGAGGVDRWFAKPLQPAEFVNDLAKELWARVVA